jgi:hypothetical protein
VINPLLTRAQIVDGHGVQIASQPTVAAVTTELNALIAQLSNGQNGAGRTAAVTTAACAAVLGSAAIVLH